MILFTKMHGLGNDFMVIDAINQEVALSAEHIRQLSDRHFGVGFDQLLLVEPPQSDNADFKYRIFNADGSEVGQCGNGARCFARFVRDKQLSLKDQICVDTHSGQLTLSFEDNGMITVNMGVPRHAPSDIPLLADQESRFYTVTVNGQERAFGAVSMGNPHAVIQVHDIKNAQVEIFGKALESHALFPERANIGFMQIIDRSHIKLRVYERGAAETLACGSGACAAVVIGFEQNLLDNQVVVELPGGILQIAWAGRGHPVLMTGPADSVFEGRITLTEGSLSTTGLSSNEVEIYLLQHPEFFNDHLSLLEQLSIPHPSGNAVSLITKQLEIFRSRHHELENQLEMLIDIAKDNDASFTKMHKLTLALLEAETLEQAVRHLEIVLSDYFLTDFVAIRIIRAEPVGNMPGLFIAPDSDKLRPFLAELSDNQPSCGAPTPEQARELFADAALQVKSCAIVPMVFTEFEGILGIGSREKDRFHHSMGHLFLTQMSEIIATRLVALLK